MTHPQSSPYIAEKPRKQDWSKWVTLLNTLRRTDRRSTSKASHQTVGVTSIHVLEDSQQLGWHTNDML
jgi:hypothetical protein